MTVLDTSMQLGTSGIDVDVYRWVTQNRAEPWISVSHALTVLGNTIPLALAVIIVVTGLVSTRHCSTAALVGIGSVTGYLLMVGLKALFGRDRPPVPDRLLHIDTHSFPSGHAMMTAVCFGLFAVAAYHCSKWVREHPAVLVVAPVLTIVVGCTRVYLGVHWCTDVLAGWIVGALWVVLCVSVWRARLSRR